MNFIKDDNDDNMWMKMHFLTLSMSKVQLAFLLDFIYNGEVEVEKEHLYKFLNTGEKLQLKGLVKLKGEEPKDAKKYDDTQNVKAEHDLLPPKEHDLESMITRVDENWGCLRCGKVISPYHDEHTKVTKYCLSCISGEQR